MTVFRVAADLVVALHAGFVLFVVLGGLLVLRWRRVMWVHLPAAAWGVLVELNGWVCPLTPLEQVLRARAGEAAYAGDFIQRYMMRALYPANLTREAQLAMGMAALLVNGLIYILVWRRRTRAARCR